MNTIVATRIDVGRRRLADEIEDDGPEQQADRDVGRRGMERMPEPPPVEQVLDRPERPEQGAQPAMVEVPERLGPAVLEGHETSEQIEPWREPPWWTLRRSAARMAVPCYPQPVHIGGNLGDNFEAPRRKFVDKAVVAPGARRRTFRLARRGRCEPPDRTGERSSGRSREPGSRAARPASEVPGGDPETADLFGADGTRRTGRSPPVPSGAFVCPGPRCRCLATSTPAGPLGSRGDPSDRDPIPGPGTPAHRARTGACLVAVFWVTSMVEGLGVSQIFALLPSYLREMGVAETDRLAFVGLFSALIFVVGHAARPAVGRLGRQVQPQGRDRPERARRGGRVRRRGPVARAVAAGAQHAADRIPARQHRGDAGRHPGRRRRVGGSGTIDRASSGRRARSGIALGPALAGILIDGLGWSLPAVFCAVGARCRSGPRCW